MERLILAQFYENTSLSKEEQSELLKKIDVNYCIPDTLPGREENTEWAGYTSLHFAAQTDGVDDLAMGLLQQGANLFKQGTADGCTPLHQAVNCKSIYKKSGRLTKYSLIDSLLSKQVEINNNHNPKCKHGTSHFHIACIVNHAEAVEFFVKAKVDLDQQINSDAKYLPGFTALHCAIHYSSVEAANILLQHGADINIKNAKGLSCVQLLLQRLIDINDVIKMGKRRLCGSYQEEIQILESIIKLFLKMRLNDETFLNDTGLSALHVACTLRDKSFVQDFLKHGFDLNISVKSESEFWPRWTPLHFAACLSIDIVKLLIQNGANIMVKNSKGETPLDLFAKRFTAADIQSILSMVNSFKDITLSDNSTKLSDLLLAMNNYGTFNDFLKKLKNPNITIPFSSPIWPGYNLLHICVCLNEKTNILKDFEKNFRLPGTKDAAVENYTCTEDEEALYDKRIELCLEYGCTVSMKNAQGQTPIHLAFSLLREATVVKLLKSNNENVADVNGLTHLHIASTLGSLYSVKRYLNEGADVDSQVKISYSWRDREHEKWDSSISPKNIRENSTPLHAAVVFGHDDIVKFLLNNKADVYARDSMGFTPIHLLIYSHPIRLKSIADLLFEATPNLRDSVSSVGLSHLHVTAWVDEVEVVEKLLHNGAEVDQVIDADVQQFSFLKDWAGATPLHMARGTSVNSLLKAGANVYAKDSEGVTALQHALRDMSLPSSTYFIRLVKKGKCEVESCGMTPLHIACAKCDIKWAKKLLKKGADVNARMTEGTMQGATPLHMVVEDSGLLFFNRPELVDIIKLLVENGADLTIECDGSTPLHLIYEQNYEDALYDDDVAAMEIFSRAADLLLKSIKCHEFNPVNNQGFSHFHFACVRNDVETATKFLDHGVDVNASTDPFADENPAFTPLHFAMAYRSTEVAYLLLERGANVNAQDAKGNRPLHVALKKEFVDLTLLETMIRQGADLNAKNMCGETLLYCLLGYGALTLERLEFFLKCGCSINILNATNECDQGIIGLAMHSAAPNELQSILERLMQVSEVTSAVQSGFNLIHSIVAIDGDDYESDAEENNDDENEVTLDNYLSAIEMAMNLACDLDGRDSTGQTALHTAVSFWNVDAINALLQLGADINVANNEDKYPFSDEIITFATEDEDDDVRETDIVKAFAGHVWKMKCVELQIQESNLRCFEKAEQKFSIVASIEQSCLDELTKAKETEICQGLTVRDFLSELGATSEYPRMCPIRRAIIDKFFNNAVDIRREFPEFCGLLALQYRKATARLEMWYSAKEVIALICPFGLPDLCLEAILRYFRNDEMRLLIEIENCLYELFDSC